jgi:MYXO-CTERM domain-containing protein
MFALTTELPPLVDTGVGPGEGEGEGPGEGEGEGSVIGTPGDVDGDGTENLVDNCPELFNAAQADADLDGLGDGCDLCPLTAPGALVDAEGCGDRDTPLEGGPGRANPRLVDPGARSALERECGCTTNGNTDGAPAIVMGLVLLRMVRRRRHA